MKVLMLHKIRSDFDGYNSLISLYHYLLGQNDSEIILDFIETEWFEANLSAVLGAICVLVEEQGSKMTVSNINPVLLKVLCRNLFLCEFGYDKLEEDLGTIITYRKFTPYEDIEFMDYIRNELLSKPDFPKHSKLLGKKINESIFELFENARTHGHCKKIYTCGQYYPNKKTKRLDITIVDMGKTIKTNVNEYLKQNLSGSEAIEWALEYGHTTKTGTVSGGLGLDIIFEFIKLNNGKIQIISSDGYWEYRRGIIEKKLFEDPFPGTIANIEFNLDDDKSYILKEEISLDDIF
jgi:hypothetical protein